MSHTRNAKSLRQMAERGLESTFCIGITLFVAIGFFKMLTPAGVVA